MKEYELMVVFKPLLPEDTKEDVQAVVSAIVTNKAVNGEIKSTDVWGKRHLAYEIGGYDEGYYIVYRLNVEPKNTEKINQKLKNNQDVLRSLLIDVNKL